MRLSLVFQHLVKLISSVCLRTVRADGFFALTVLPIGCVMTCAEWIIWDCVSFLCGSRGKWRSAYNCCEPCVSACGACLCVAVAGTLSLAVTQVIGGWVYRTPNFHEYCCISYDCCRSACVCVITIAGAIDAVLYTVPLGFSVAVCTLAGNLLGAADVTSAKRVVFAGLAMSTAVAITLGGVIVAAHAVLPSVRRPYQYSPTRCLMCLESAPLVLYIFYCCCLKVSSVRFCAHVCV